MTSTKAGRTIIEMIASMKLILKTSPHAVSATLTMLFHRYSHVTFLSLDLRDLAGVSAACD